VKLTALSVYRLFRECGILSISQPYRPSRYVMGVTVRDWEGIGRSVISTVIGSDSGIPREI
jgi:hypothetical protein